ncbi:MAG: hypothetical protein U0K18_05115 [Acutalibacteraceae bacterium]|nr:hypothetical protein [Clostridia bacterium]MEE1330569.1 hypothetical protein [Acutalibacteraceae bacterium]
MYCNEESRNNSCQLRRNCRCSSSVVCILALLLFFVAGAIAGAYAAEFVVSAIVPISIFAIILLIGVLTSLWLRHCRDC